MAKMFLSLMEPLSMNGDKSFKNSTFLLIPNKCINKSKLLVFTIVIIGLDRIEGLINGAA